MAHLVISLHILWDCCIAFEKVKCDQGRNQNLFENENLYSHVIFEFDDPWFSAQKPRNHNPNHNFLFNMLNSNYFLLNFKKLSWFMDKRSCAEFDWIHKFHSVLDLIIMFYTFIHLFKEGLQQISILDSE